MENGKTALGLDKNVGGLLCYLPICGISLIYSIIVIVTDKDNRDVRFHAFQSLLIFGATIALGFAFGIVIGILGYISPTLGGILGLLLQLVWIIAILGAYIMCMIKAYQGQQFKLPVIGDMAEKWANG